MNLFKRMTFEWWHIAALKTSVFALGIAVGAAWPEIFARYIIWLIVVAVMFGLYVTSVWWKKS